MILRPGPGFEAFIAPARSRSGLGRLLLGMAVLGGVYLAGALGLLWGAAHLAQARGLPLSEDLLEPSTPGGMITVLSTFVALALGTWAAARLVHGRCARSLFGPRLGAVWRDAWRCGGATLALFVLLGLPALFWHAPVPNLAPGPWLALLPLALLLVLVQITAEEIAFRGYLLQQLAARFRSPLVWGVLPAALFGLAHWNPAEMGGNAGAVVLATGLFGLAAADLTARTGNLGAALGLHMANNVLALLVVSLDGTLTGLALFVTPFAASDVEAMRPLVWLDIAALLLAWALCRRLTRPAPSELQSPPPASI